MEIKTTKQLIIIIVLVATISYSLDKIVFFGLNHISDQVMTGQAIGKFNQFLKLKDTSDLLVFGNSRANHHINTDVLSDRGFNIGIDGSGIALSSTLIRTLPMNRPQLIIVHIDTKNFADSTYNGSDIRSLKAKFKREDTITQALRESGHIPALHYFYYSMNYTSNVIGILKNYFKPSYNYRTYSGYDPIPVSSTQYEMRDIILAKKNSQDCNSFKELNPLAINYLKSIKSFKEKATEKKFIFITSPNYDDNCNNDNLALKRVLKNFDLTYWDFSNYFKHRNNNSLWKDKTHLSKQGAEEFSKMLREKLDELKL